MLRSIATVPTARAARYRDQLASHGAGMLRRLNQDDHAGRPPIEAATVADGVVLLRLVWGTCSISATDEALVLAAEAETQADLTRIQNGVGQRVSRIGRRDDLTVIWSPAEGEAAITAGSATSIERPRRSLTTSTIVLLVGVVLAVHLGLGALVLGQDWAWWALAAVAGLVALKVVAARHAFAYDHKRGA